MLIEACRTDIGDQIIQFKTEQRQKSDHCHVCNISILPGESETDHYPTSFSDILNIFLSTIDISTIKLTRYKHIRWSIENPEIKQQWQKLHRQHARYRELCKECHRLHTKQQNKH